MYVIIYSRTRSWLMFLQKLPSLCMIVADPYVIAVTDRCLPYSFLQCHKRPLPFPPLPPYIPHLVS